MLEDPHHSLRNDFGRVYTDMGYFVGTGISNEVVVDGTLVDCSFLDGHW